MDDKKKSIRNDDDDRKYRTNDSTTTSATVIDLSSDVTTLNPGSSELFSVLIHDVLSSDECKELIKISECSGFKPALVNQGNGKEVLATDVRKSDRCIIDDYEFVKKLYARIRKKLTDHDNINDTDDGRDVIMKERFLLPHLLNYNLHGKMHCTGLNERLRILRYDPGCYFLPHYDGRYVRGNELGPKRKGETSRLSLLLYLNDGYEGGRTRFLRHSGRNKRHDNGRRNNKLNDIDVDARQGSVLLFDHDCYHEGEFLKKGRKYVVRTDVMYKNPTHA